MKVITKELPKFTEIEIYPFADVHIGDEQQDKKRIKQFIDEVLDQENRYVIVNGDILNWASKSSVSDIFKEELNPNQQIDMACSLLRPIKDRIIAVTEGNHEKRAYKTEGILLMYQVCQRLEIFNVYSEGAYLLFLSFGMSQGRDCRKLPYTIYGKHGSGGGKRPGGKVNRLEDMTMIVDADIYLHSHTHLPFAMKKSFFRCDYKNRKITEVEKLFVNTNAFLSYGGYGEDYGFTPSSTQYPKIVLNGIERESKVIL